MSEKINNNLFDVILNSFDVIFKEKEKQEEADEAEEQSRTKNKEKLEEDDDNDDKDEDNDDTTITSRFSGLSTDDNGNQAEQDLKENLIDKDEVDKKQEQECSPVSCETIKRDSKMAENTNLQESIEDEKTANEYGKYLDKDRTEDTASDKKLNKDLLGLLDDGLKKNESETNSSSGANIENKFILDSSGKILTSEEFMELCQLLHQKSMEDNSDGSEEMRDERPKITTIGMVRFD